MEKIDKNVIHKKIFNELHPFITRGKVKKYAKGGCLSNYTNSLYRMKDGGGVSLAKFIELCMIAGKAPEKIVGKILAK